MTKAHCSKDMQLIDSVMASLPIVTFSRRVTARQKRMQRREWTGEGVQTIGIGIAQASTSRSLGTRGCDVLCYYAALHTVDQCSFVLS